MNGGEPMVPVSPDTVIVMMPPMVGGFGPEVTTVTLLALASMVSRIWVIVNDCDAYTVGERLGAFESTRTVCDSLTVSGSGLVGMVALQRKKNAALVWPAPIAPKCWLPVSVPAL